MILDFSRYSWQIWQLHFCNPLLRYFGCLSQFLFVFLREVIVIAKLGPPIIILVCRPQAGTLLTLGLWLPITILVCIPQAGRVLSQNVGFVILEL